MTKTYSDRDIQMMLLGYVRAFMNSHEAAMNLECDDSQLSKMLRGERPVSERTLSALGLSRVTVYKDR
jgi:hypothetical protein